MKRIKLGRRSVYALVDDTDFAEVRKHHWYLMNTGYVETFRKRDGKVSGRTTLHRFILNPAAGQMIDHINRNKLDCRRTNLRLATFTQNNCNLQRTNKFGTYRGVRPRDRRWEARITIDRRSVSLGRFDSPEEAAMAYNSAAESCQGEFAILNKVA